MLKRIHFSRSMSILFLFGWMFSTGMSLLMASSVENCNKTQMTCDISIEEGEVGDEISILNERAQPVAVGTLQSRQGRKGVVKLSQVFRDVKRRYPVVVNIENRGKQRQWVARER